MLNEKQLVKLEEAKKVVLEINDSLMKFTELMNDMELPSEVTKRPKELNKDNLNLYLNLFIYESTSEIIQNFNDIKLSLDTFTDEKLQQELFKGYAEVEKQLSSIVSVMDMFNSQEGDLN